MEQHVIVENIEQTMAQIEKAIKWIPTSKAMQGSKGERMHRDLIDKWCVLRRKKNAMKDNPAAAAYGESQVGKSYLISALLSQQGKSYGIVGHDGTFYSFKRDINPQGGGKESTSLITRFTSNYVPENSQFPIKAVMLSPTDLILVVCEAYFHNVDENAPLSFETIKQRVNDIHQKYATQPVCHNLIGEADIYDILDYFEAAELPKTKYNNLRDAQFFNCMVDVIQKVPPRNWKDVFSLFWNDNPRITKLYNDLVVQHEQLDFASEVYLPIDAILRRKGTLLDVARMDEIYAPYIKKTSDDEYNAETALQYHHPSTGQIRTMAAYSKSFLCALISEIVVSVPEGTKQEKPFLENIDLLDIPGLRRFETVKSNQLTDNSLSTILRRGKVDCLFNQYSMNERINILLFCQNHLQSSQSVMPDKLDRWIRKMIGSTSEDREKYVNDIPQLFIISTWFNVDMEYKVDKDKVNDMQSLNYRWKQRFDSTLVHEITKTDDTYDWMDHWTQSKPYFQNIYMLRDFGESYDKIFKIPTEVEKKGHVEGEEKVPDNYPDFRRHLRETFINYDFVKKHFANPALSWDSAAARDNDGTIPIIDNLTKRSGTIMQSRMNKNIDDLAKILNDIIQSLPVNDENKETLLQNALYNAGHIQLNMDIAFGRDPFFYGKMMRVLLLHKDDIYNLFKKMLNSIEKRQVVNLDRYAAIRMNVPELNPSLSYEQNLELLCKHYNKKNADECESYFKKENIELKELFFGDTNRVKNFATQLVDATWDYWENKHIADHREELNNWLSQEGADELIAMLGKLFGPRGLGVSILISERLRHYVDGYRNIENVYNMAADICAEMFNKFINTIGKDYFTITQENDLKEAAKHIDGLSWEHPELQFDSSTCSVSSLLTLTGNLSELLNQTPLPIEVKRLPIYANYIEWYDSIKAGFVLSAGVPAYDDFEANKALKVIKDEFIKQCKTNLNVKSHADSIR